MRIKFWRKRPKPIVYTICQIVITSGIDSYSPTGEHHIAFCTTCDQFVDSDPKVPVLAIEEHIIKHKKRSK